MTHDELQKVINVLRIAANDYSSQASYAMRKGFVTTTETATAKATDVIEAIAILECAK